VAGSAVTFAGLAIFRVSNEKGFERLGGVEHDPSRAHCGQWWSRSTSDVKRSVFVDDLVYSMATDRLKVQRMGAFGKDVADLRLAP
jgi:hypothetical protein